MTYSRRLFGAVFVLFIFACSIIAHAAEPHWEIDFKTSTSLSMRDTANGTLHWESQLTSATRFVQEKLEADSDHPTRTYAIQYADGRQDWKMDLSPWNRSAGCGVFANGKAYVIMEGDRQSGALLMLDLERRDFEEIGWIYDSYFIDPRRNLFAFEIRDGEVFVNHTRIFPKPLSGVKYERGEAWEYKIENGKKTPAESSLNPDDWYFPRTKVIVKENMDVEFIIMKSKVSPRAEPHPGPFFPEKSDQEFHLIEAHPEFADPEAPGKWTIKDTILPDSEAPAMIRLFNGEKEQPKRVIANADVSEPTSVTREQVAALLPDGCILAEDIPLDFVKRGAARKEKPYRLADLDTDGNAELIVAYYASAVESQGSADRNRPPVGRACVCVFHWNGSKFIRSWESGGWGSRFGTDFKPEAAPLEKEAFARLFFRIADINGDHTPDIAFTRSVDTTMESRFECWSWSGLKGKFVQIAFGPKGRYKELTTNRGWEYVFVCEESPWNPGAIPYVVWWNPSKFEFVQDDERTKVFLSQMR